MKIVNRRLGKTADASSGKGTALAELRQLVIYATALAVTLYVCVGFAVDRVVAGISFETEAAVFGSFSPKVERPEHAPEGLGQARRVLEELTNDPEAPPLPFRLVLVANDQPNAFAFPGGCIGVTEGLLDALTDEVELAFVLGHELGHYRHRDHLRGIGRAVGTSVAFSIVFGGEAGASKFGNILHSVLQRSYSRRRETAADRFAVEIVHRTYGRTEGIDRLFNILEDSGALPDWAYMFATHPSPASRIDDLKQHAHAISGQ